MLFYLPFKLTLNIGEVSQICKREGLKYVCVQREENTAQKICEILDSPHSDDELFESPCKDDNSVSRKDENSEKTLDQNLEISSRNLEDTSDLLSEMSELEKITAEKDGNGEGKPNSTKTLGTTRKTRSQSRQGKL